MNRFNSRTVFLLAVAVAIALLVRCLSFANFVNPDGGFYFYSIDSYDHLRRITLGVKSFPAIASFDYYAAFPQGLGQIWAPLFDYIFSLICLIAGGSKEVIETVCFFSGPFLAACAVVAVFFAAKYSFGSIPAALFASFVLALHPGSISYSLPMNFDHHAVEPLLVLLLFSLPLFGRERGSMPWSSVLIWVGTLVFTVFVWRGSSLYWGFSFLSAFGRCLAIDDKRLAKSYAQIFVSTAVFFVFYCLFDPWGNAGQMSFGIISWFHVTLLLIWSGLFFFYACCRTQKIFFSCLAGVVFCLVILLITGFLEGGLAQLKGGLSFLRGKGDPWLEANSELRSVFSARYSTWFSLSYLTLFWAVSPVAVCLAFWQWFRDKNRVLLLNFIAWSPLIVMGSVIRYTHVMGVFVALAAAFLAAFAWRWCNGQLLCRVLIVGIGIVLFLPGLPHYKNTIAGRLPDHMKYGLYGKDGVLEWIRKNTPETSYYSNPVSVPEYGVLARWSMGARIYQLAARPSLSTAFGWETHGFYQEAGFWVAQLPKVATQLLRDNNIRYVVVKARHDLQSDYALTRKAISKNVLAVELLGVDPFMVEYAMYSRLQSGDGGGMVSAAGFLPALGNYRLVYESSFLTGGAINSSFYKVFEVVPGAVVVGKAPSGMPVSISLELLTGRKRKMVYFDKVVATRDGEFSFLLPYSTFSKQGDTLPAQQYVLRIGGFAPSLVVVSEKQVQNGAVIELAIP